MCGVCVMCVLCVLCVRVRLVLAYHWQRGRFSDVVAMRYVSGVCKLRRHCLHMGPQRRWYVAALLACVVGWAFEAQ